MPGIRQLRTWTLRDFVFAITIIGMVGLAVELLLLDHTENFTQWIPLLMLGGGVVASMLLHFRPSAATVRVFQVLMVGLVVAGLAGIYFHYVGNAEFALERDSALSGTALVWNALRGATPALAPAALAQLGLLGLAYTHSHPARHRNQPGESR